jgi:hypothetical protein
MWLRQRGRCPPLPADSCGFWSWSGRLRPKPPARFGFRFGRPMQHATVSAAMSLGASGSPARLLRAIWEVRAQLPAEHRNRSRRSACRRAVIEDWSSGVQGLFRCVQELSPSDAALVNAAARCGWMGSAGLRLTASDAHDYGSDGCFARPARRHIAWHKYGHALSLTRSIHARRSTTRAGGLQRLA